MWLFLTPTHRSHDVAYAQYDFWPKHVLNNVFGRQKQQTFNFWHTAQSRQTRKAQTQTQFFFLKGTWPYEPDKIRHSLKHISKRSKAICTDLKYGTRIHIDIFSKNG